MDSNTTVKIFPTILKAYTKLATHIALFPNDMVAQESLGNFEKSLNYASGSFLPTIKEYSDKQVYSAVRREERRKREEERKRLEKEKKQDNDEY